MQTVYMAYKVTYQHRFARKDETPLRRAGSGPLQGSFLHKAACKAFCSMI